MISVCLASYNGERYIKEQVLSILNQLSVDDELIISDDGSTDNTLHILATIKDSRVRVISNSFSEPYHKYSNSHYKVTRNFENALSSATGDYIFLSDQDDIWEQDKVLITVATLQQCELVMSNRSIIDSNGNLVKLSAYSTNPIGHCFFRNVIKMPFYGCCMAFKKELLKEILPFPKNLIMHDNWIGLYACLRKRNIAYIDKPLIRYRRHQYNVSPTAQKNPNPIYFKIRYRFVILIQLLIRYSHYIKSHKKLVS